jgi:transcriptional regulator with XRE-family HTH domain
MAKAKSYKLQGREWTVKDLAEELGLSTPRVHGLLKEHNEDIKAIFESRGITPKPADKGPKARLFDYKGKQWTVKQLAEEFGLSNVRVNRLIKEFDGDIEKIASSREKNKKENGASEIKKASETEMSNDKTDIAVDDEEIEFIKDSMTKETFLKYLDQEELSTRFNEGDIKFKILILFNDFDFTPTDCDSLELDLNIGDTQDFEEWIRYYCFSINEPEITFSFIHGNLNKDNNEFTIRVEESGDECFYINYTMLGQDSTTADAADPKSEIRESYKLLEKVLTKTGIIFDETEKAPKDDNSDCNSTEQSGSQQGEESTNQFKNMSDELLDELLDEGAAWIAAKDKDSEIYLCKGELDENLGDDYDLIIVAFYSDRNRGSESIFRDILRYFKNLYENGCDEYPRITMKYKVGNELVTLGLIECILDKEELDNFDNSIKNCNEIFGFEPVEIEKEDISNEKLKPIFYYGIDYLESDIDLEKIIHRVSGNSKANQSIELKINYDTPDGFMDAYKKTVSSLGEFIELCKEIKMEEEQDDKHIMIDGEKFKNHLMFLFYKDEIYLGSCGMFKLEENVDDFINGENDYPEYHDQIDFLSTSSVSTIADDVTAFINIGATWDSIDN